METPHTQITVARTLENDIGFRDVILLLDEKRLATLRYGQSVTRDIEPGHHKLRAHNTLTRKTVEFDVQPGDHMRFVTSNRAGFGTSLMFLLGVGPIYITLQQEGDRALDGPT